MLPILLQMAGLIACGILWRITSPRGLAAADVRLVLTTVVYWVFLPGLILKVLWVAELGETSFKIIILGFSTLLFGLGLMLLLCKVCSLPKALTGAVILAAIFPNVSYMGIPVLERLYGDVGSSIAIQYDVFVSSPLLFTMGVFLARHFGTSDTQENIFKGMFKTPPLWAALIAIGLNAFEVPQPAELGKWLAMIGAPVVPIMLFSVGLSLSIKSLQSKQIPVLVPIVMMQLLIAPLFAMGLLKFLSLPHEYNVALVLEAGMPTMILGIVVCDQFKLNTELYATAITVTTALSLITLELWFTLLN